MSKICGIVSRKNDIEHKNRLIRRMLYSMRHESWHKIEQKSFQYIAMGHLSIQKFNLEPQPIWNQCRTKCIVMAGKIFDYSTMRTELEKRGHAFRYLENDAEFILHCYEEKGTSFIKDLYGLFTFAIWDEENKRVVIVNDRYGMRPLYYYADKEKFIFASEVKGLLADKSLERKINWKAWGDFFIFEGVNGNETFFENIFALPAASTLIYEGGRLFLYKYWEGKEIKIEENQSENYFLEKGKTLIEQAVKRQIKGLKEAICFLSGGYDSRCIAYTISQLMPQTLDFKTYTTPKIAYKNIMDCLLAVQVARRLKLNHTIAYYGPDSLEMHREKWFYITDGLCPLHLWLMPLIFSLGRGTLVNFEGMGGDLFGRGVMLTETNVRYSFENNNDGILNILRKEKADRVKIVKKLFRNRYSDCMIEKSFDFIKKDLIDLNTPNKVSLFYLQNRIRRNSSLVPLLVLTKAETFCPLMDKDLVEFALTIPPYMKLQDKFYRTLLKRMYPDFFNVATVSGGQYLPADLQGIRRRFYDVSTRILKGKILKRIKAESQMPSKRLLSKSPDAAGAFSGKGFNIENIEHFLNEDIDRCPEASHLLMWHEHFFVT